MKVARQQSLTQPFVLDDTELERLGQNLDELTPDLRFEVVCKDGLKREFDSLRELLSFEHPPKKEIKTLRIAGYSKDVSTSVWLKYDKGLQANVFLSLEGDEGPVLRINDSIEEHLARVKPWYSLLARLDFTLVLGLFLLCLMLVFVIIPAIVNSTLRETLSQSFRSFSQTVIGMLFGLVLIVVGLIINALKATMFPMGVFAIGQGAKRHKDKEIVRTVVVIGFLISLVSSIVAALIFTR